MIADFTPVLEKQGEEMPSLNHSFVCAQVMKQLLQNDDIQPLPELTLDIDKGATPDISIFPRANVQPNFFEDVLKLQQLPFLAIEVVSSSQSVQEMLMKAATLINAGIKTVWVVEPYGRSIFVISDRSKQLFHEEPVESNGVRVDFAKVFSLS
jgi:Uma2 family endonuclease